MLIVGTRGHFDAAHYIPGHPKCGEVHGHRWEVEVEYKTLEPIVLDDFSMLVDFGEIKTPIRMLDHPGTELNKLDGLECPTAEIIAMWLFDQMPPALCCCLVTVTVWESPDSYAIWSGTIMPMVERVGEAIGEERVGEEMPF